MKDSQGKETVHPARIEDYKSAGVDAPMPETDNLQLFEWLMQVGPAEATGMGPVPLSWRTIGAWQRLTGTIIDGWDALTLKRLSTEYLSELNLAEDPARPCPWSRPVTHVDRAANERQLRAALGLD